MASTANRRPRALRWILPLSLITGVICCGDFPDGPLGGAALTVVISIMAGVASAVLGTVLGVALAMSRGVWAGILAAVLGFFRAIPVIMLIFWTYFLLPIVLVWIYLKSPLWCVHWR